MLKLVHLSDLHLTTPGEELHGLRPGEQLERCISRISREPGDAALCIITGDLTHDGHPLAYAEVARQVARLPMPVHLMLGNHDDRAAFRRPSPTHLPIRMAPADPNGFIQQVIDTSYGRLILLDTHEPQRAEGRLCERRLAWLRDRIAAAASYNKVGSQWRGKPISKFQDKFGAPTNRSNSGDAAVLTWQRSRVARILHHAVVIQIEGSSYWLRQHAELMPEHVRSKALIALPAFAPPSKPHGRPPKNGHLSLSSTSA